MTGRRFLARQAGVIAAYALLTVIMTYPVITRLATAVPGDNTDSWLHLWNIWWVKHALLDLRQNPFHTSLLYHPQGVSLYYHSLILVPSLLGLPVALLAGLAAAYNIIAFLGYILGGYGAYCLADYLLAGAPALAGDKRRAAFLAGCIFTFSAYHSVRLWGHLDLVSLQWLPFYILFLLRTWREPGWRNPLLAALFLALASLSMWYYAIHLVVFTLFFVAYQVAAGRERRRVSALLRVAVALIAYAVLLSPLLIPMLRSGPEAGRVANVLADSLSYSGDLLALFMPSPFHPLAGPLLKETYQAVMRNGNLVESTISLGYVPLILLVWAIKPLWQKWRFWLLAALLFALLALGPQLHIGGETVSVFGRPLSLPYSLLMRLPFFDSTRSPGRFVVVANLSLAVMAAYAGVLVMRGRSRPRAWFAALLGAILIESASFPFPMQSVAVSPFYKQIAQEPQPVALLEVPIRSLLAQYSRRMLFQTEHGKPVFGGYISRGELPFAYHTLPGFAQLQALTPGLNDIVAYDPRSLGMISRFVLHTYQTGYVVVDKTLLAEEPRQRALAAARAIFDGAEPDYEDETLAAYAVPPPPTPSPTFMYVDSGWYVLERAAPGQGPVWRWMADEASLGLTAGEEGMWRVRLRAWAWQATRRIEVSIDDASVAVIPVAAQDSVYETPSFRVVPGSHVIRLRSLDGVSIPGGNDLRPLSIAVAEVALIR